MALIRRDNRSSFTRAASLDPFRIMDAFLAGQPYAAVDSRDGTARAFAPRFEVKETKDAYVFKADVPGVADADVEIQMTGNVLTIAGQRRQESTHEGERYFAIERGYGQFSRAFALPDGTDSEHITADLKEGVLTVRVPKRPEVQPRKITIGRTPTTPTATEPAKG
jgi:HSP20 family protein